MPKHNAAHRQARPAIAPARFDFTVRTVRAQPGGKFIEGSEFRCSSIQDAKNSADRIQREFDEDCDPCRAYVYGSGSPVPVYAGMQFVERYYGRN